MKLRDYQENAVEGILNTWQTEKSALVVLPTGCGKTVVFAETIRRALAAPNSTHAMILAHREELVDQAADKIRAVTGFDCEIEMGERQVIGMMGKLPPVIVSSVQSQISGKDGKKRMHKFDPKDFSVLVIDEAHHATSPSYRKCVDWYLKGNPDCRLLGVTATPDRADELALGSVFAKVAASYEVVDAIRDGWLVPIKQRFVTVGSLDFSAIKTTAGDLNQGELAEVMEDERNLHEIAAPVLDILKGKRAIVFATSIRQAERLAEILNRGARADWICGATPKEVRREKLERFKRGEIEFMVNVGVLTEGFDDAGVDAVVMARPTKSRALYAQMIGRATRPAAEIAAALGLNSEASKRRELIAASSKPSCLVLDFVGNSGRHKLITSADILGGKNPEEVIARAKRKASEKTNVNMADALEEAKLEYEEIERRKRLQAERRKAVKALAPYCLTTINPFDVYDLAPAPERSDEVPRRFSEKQADYLRSYYGIDPKRITYAQGAQLLDAGSRRQRAGLASYKQTKFLRRKGIPVPVGFEEAKRILDRRCA